MEIKLLKNHEEFLNWCNLYTGSGIYWHEETPTSYPCLIVWYQYDINNSMSYGWGIVSEFIYRNSFEENNAIS